VPNEANTLLSVATVAVVATTALATAHLTNPPMTTLPRLTNNAHIERLQKSTEHADVMVCPPLTLAPSPSFVVRDVPVYGDLILAPMAGFSDVPYRIICREYGSAMSYTEFASVEGVMGQARRTRRTLAFSPTERPVVFQIFGADVDLIVQSCRRVQEWGPDIIDINLGCSTPKISGRGAGAGLLCDPTKIGRIFTQLTQAVHVPVTAKIRLGWDNASRNYVQVAHILEDSGASLITVHGRTRAQNYGDPADWDAVAQVKQSVKVPVIGNGDVTCVDDIERIKRHTGCDGVMIGRAAMGNPWIFQRRDWDQISFAEKTAMLRRHLAAMVDFYGEGIGVILFRKHIVRYLRGLDHVTPTRTRLLTCGTAEQVLQALEAFELQVENC
jgi:nifR3 family TIM-barrel protein